MRFTLCVTMLALSLIALQCTAESEDGSGDQRGADGTGGIRSGVGQEAPPGSPPTAAAPVSSGDGHDNEGDGDNGTSDKGDGNEGNEGDGDKGQQVAPGGAASNPHGSLSGTSGSVSVGGAAEKTVTTTTTSTAANAAPAHSKPDESQSQPEERKKGQDQLQGTQNKTIQPPEVKQQQVDAVKKLGTNEPTQNGAPPPKPLRQPNTAPLQSQPLQSSTNHHPQQLHDQSHTISQGEVKIQGDPGNNLQNGRNVSPTSINKDAPQTLPVVTQSRPTDAQLTNKEPHVHGQHGPKEQPSTPSHPTKAGVQQTPERQPTTTTNTDKILGEDTNSVKTRTEKTPKDHNNAPEPHSISTNNKRVRSDTNNTPNTTADKNPVAAQQPEPLTPATSDNAVDQSAPITGNTKIHLAQTSLTSTDEPVKEEFSLPANISRKLPKAMQSLDMTDSSIGTLSHVSLAALTIVFVMAVSPAS